MLVKIQIVLKLFFSNVMSRALRPLLKNTNDVEMKVYLK